MRAGRASGVQVEPIEPRRLLNDEPSVPAIQQLEARRLLAFPEPDLSFGEGGVAAAEQFVGSFFVVNQLADGKIVAAGNGTGPASAFAGSDDPLVARFNPDGTLDRTFDGDGTLFRPQDHTVIGTSDAALAPDGKIVVLHAVTEGHEIRIFRFNADGTIDNSFGTGGVVSHPMSAFSLLFGLKLAVQGDGKILITFDGSSSNPDRREIYLSRLNADGSLDASFRGGLMAANPTGFTALDDLVATPDGKIYVAGVIQSHSPYYQRGTVARYNADGTPDLTYGGGDGQADVVDISHAVVGSGDGLEAPNAQFLRIALDRNGKLLVSSQFNDYPNLTSIRLTRFTKSGVFDKTFGGGDGAIDLGEGLLPMPMVAGADGRITGAASGGPLMLYRVNPSGALDQTFGSGGRFIANRSIAGGDALTLDRDGNILIASSTDTPLGSQVAVARLVADSVDVALNSVGRLVVNGTDDADVISFEHAGTRLIVHRNGVDSSFALADVKRVIVYPSAGGDVITLPFAIAASLSGGSGNDTINASDGVDITIDGGAGNDKVFCGDGSFHIDTGKGKDRVSTGGGNNNISSGAGNDLIITGDGNDTIDAGDGDDVVSSGGGNDEVYSGNGNDIVHAGAGNDKIQDVPDPVEAGEGLGASYVGLSSGKKMYFGQLGNDHINGSTGDDILWGNGGQDTIVGAEGNDFISSGGGSDQDYGDITDSFDIPGGGDNGGDDTVTAGEGDDLVVGGDGDDSLTGDVGNDTVHGSMGNDLVVGNDGDDKLFGEFGNDSIFGNGGRDYVEGGDGLDLVRGNSGNDRLHGNGGNDRIYGGPGDDVLLGEGGSNQLFGEDGNDQLQGEYPLRDTLRGGAGDDMLFSKDSAIDDVFGDLGRDTATADKNDVLSSVEVIA